MNSLFPLDICTYNLNATSMTSDELAELRQDLGWLVDIPLFIDTQRVASLYDITVEPVFEPYRKEEVASKEDEETDRQFTLGGNADITLETNSLLDFIGGAKLGLGGDGKYDKRDRERHTGAYRHRSTPQRQLAQVLLKYRDSEITSDGKKHASRRHEYVEDISKFDWEDINRDKSSPRDIVALQLPGSPDIYDEEKGPNGDYRATLVPTAAEFEDGEICPIYPELGDDRDPPGYPQRETLWDDLGEYYEVNSDEYSEGKEIGGDLLAARRTYWQWFRDHFDPKSTTRTIEEVAADHGRIRWIDFRLPVREDGQTLHLHISPREQYPTGTFAYNFVKRGYKHGLILVGTLKSEPDMDVLAIYER